MAWNSKRKFQEVKYNSYQNLFQSNSDESQEPSNSKMKSSSERMNLEIELLQLETLIRQNKHDKENLHHLKGKSVTGPVVQSIFYICEKFALSNVIKFVAIDIHDKWMIAIHEELNSYIMKSDFEKEEVSLIEERFRKTALLRICTCIQLASKIGSRKKYVRNREMKVILEKIGYSFELKQIIASEMRVFRALNFRLNFTTILEIVELLLTLLGLMNVPDWRKFRYISLKILECVYLFRSKIYAAFHAKTGRHQNLGDSLTGKSIDMHRIENDAILTAAAVLHCTVMINRPVNFAEAVLLELERLTKLDGNDFRCLALCMASFLLEVEK